MWPLVILLPLGLSERANSGIGLVTITSLPVGMIFVFFKRSSYILGIMIGLRKLGKDVSTDFSSFGLSSNRDYRLVGKKGNS